VVGDPPPGGQPGAPLRASNGTGPECRQGKLYRSYSLASSRLLAISAMNAS
jgi:hypothetical protein